MRFDFVNLPFEHVCNLKFKTKSANPVPRPLHSIGCKQSHVVARLQVVLVHDFAARLRTRQDINKMAPAEAHEPKSTADEDLEHHLTKTVLSLEEIDVNLYRYAAGMWLHK